MNMMKPFFVALLILAATMATLTPAVHAGDDDDDTNIDIKGGFWWYIHIGRYGDKCHNTYWGRRVCQNKGLTCCKHNCVNLSSHEYNCGSCGGRCPPPNHCCGGKCINVLSDPYNCGECGNDCTPPKGQHKGHKGQHKGQCHRGLCNYAE